MHNRKGWMWGVAGVLLIAMGLSAMGGCTTAAPGVTNQAGTFVATFAAAPDKVTAAAKAVVENLQLKLVSAESTALDGKVVAETAQGRDVTIKVNREDDRMSKVTVRVGTLGDRELSVLILDRIKARVE